MSISPLDWMLIRTFLAVLGEGSLSGAARKLGLAHPTVARQLTALEAGLDGPLFLRSPGGLVPTELGESLRDPARAMQAAYDHLLRVATAQGNRIAGTVRIAASEVMGVEVLPPMLADLRERHPALDLELAISDDTVDLLRRDADIAIRMMRPTQQDVVARKVADVEVGFFAHCRWVECHGRPTNLERLLETRQLVGFDQNSTLIRALRAQSDVVVQRADFGLRTDNAIAQLAAMRAGLGVAVCQVPLAARDPALERVLPDLGARLEIWLAIAPNLKGSARVRACADVLTASLARYAGG